MQVLACSFVSQCDFYVTTIFFINYGILLKKSIMYVMLEQYHFLKCEEQFFSSNIINSPYRGLICSGMWCHVNGQWFLTFQRIRAPSSSRFQEALKVSSPLRVKQSMKALWPLKMSGTTNPREQYQTPEDLNSQKYCCENLKILHVYLNCFETCYHGVCCRTFSHLWGPVYCLLLTRTSMYTELPRWQ